MNTVMNTIINRHTTHAAIPTIGIGIGVFWCVWDARGFWWGLLYGSFWPIWVGHHVASLWVK